MRLLLLCDVGSVITKATLLQMRDGAIAPSGAQDPIQRAGGKSAPTNRTWTVIGTGRAPTTLEPPHSDVLVGLREAIGDLQDKVGISLLNGSRLISPRTPEGGVDFFTATTSAGGGLRVLVAGLTSQITAQSGHKAALGAGAIVSSTLSLQDMRGDFATIEKIRRDKVDMILVTGGTDGGNVRDVLSLVEFLAMVNPSPRRGNQAKMPLVYAGNQNARDDVTGIIGDLMDVVFADNLRPNVDTESFYSVRQAIQTVFLQHMVTHTPGYMTMANWANHTIKPTPLAIGDSLIYMSKAFSDSQVNALAIDVGGSSVDVFSVLGGEVNRTVTFNMGLSPEPYQPIDVPQSHLANLGPSVQDVSRWLPWPPDEDLLRNWSFNKTLRPSSIPETPLDLLLEHGYAREIMSKALEDHRKVVTGLKGLSSSEKSHRPGMGNSDESLLNLMSIRMIVGTGGSLSNAPRPSQALMMMLDAVQPQGVTDLYVDRGFFLPSLGSLLDVLNKEDAENLLSDLIAQSQILPLGTVIAPLGPKVSPGTEIARVVIKSKETVSYSVLSGDLLTIPLNLWDFGSLPAEIQVSPIRGFSVGNGNGYSVTGKTRGGSIGLILDGRGRPLFLPHHEPIRIATLKRWWKALEAYEESIFESLEKDRETGVNQNVPKRSLVFSRSHS